MGHTGFNLRMRLPRFTILLGSRLAQRRYCGGWLDAFIWSICTFLLFESYRSTVRLAKLEYQRQEFRKAGKRNF